MFIGVDVGGTNIRVAGATSLEHPEFRGEPVRGRNSGNFETDLAFIAEAAREIAGGEPIAALGIGSTGTLNQEKSQIVRGVHNPHWIGGKVVERLTQVLGCRVYFENDAVCAGLGEAYYGDAKGDFGYVVWGTGVGGVLVHQAGQTVGFTDLNDDAAVYFREWGRACGGAALAQAQGKPTAQFTAGEWERVLTNFYSYLEIFAAQTRQRTLVVGGGLGTRHGRALAAMSTANLRLLPATHGENSGLYGAVALIEYRQS